MYSTIDTWGAERPNLLRYADRLNDNEVAWGAFSGFMLGRLGVRQTADLDLLIGDSDFDAALQCMPRGATVTEARRVAIDCVDGDYIAFTTREANVRIDNIDVQIMEPVAMPAAYGGIYRLAMTPLAAAHRSFYEFPGHVRFFAANAVDSVHAKAAMRRGASHGKADGPDIADIVTVYPIDHDYLVRRAQEIGIDGPADNFLVQYAGFSALRSVRTPLDLSYPAAV